MIKNFQNEIDTLRLPPPRNRVFLPSTLAFGPSIFVATPYQPLRGNSKSYLITTTATMATTVESVWAPPINCILISCHPVAIGKWVENVNRNDGIEQSYDLQFSKTSQYAHKERMLQCIQLHALGQIKLVLNQ